MLSKKSYEEVRQLAQREGMDFWAFTVKALEYYARRKHDTKLNLETTDTTKAVREAKATEEEWTIVDILLGQKMITHHLHKELRERGFAVGRTALSNRLLSLTEQGLIRRKKVGEFFKKDVTQWSLVNEKRAEEWLNENDPYARNKATQ